MAEAATATGRRLVEAFHDHYDPLAARTKELAGTLGRLISVEGFVARTVEPVLCALVVRNSFEPGALRHEPALGGGALMDLGVYPLHGIRHLLEEEPVRAETSVKLNPPALMNQSSRSSPFPPRCDGSDPCQHVRRSRELDSGGRRAGELRVDGVVFPSKGHSISYTIDGIERIETVAGRTTYDHQLAALIAGLASGQALPTEGHDSVATMDAVDQIYAAAGMRLL